MENSKSQDL
uniref:Uncharacterized protein n=1 Tax=Arundo donax TaxID=35708 RepID=A0A0A9AGS1_ARUDO